MGRRRRGDDLAGEDDERQGKLEESKSSTS